jgi:hypothetical protein
LICFESCYEPTSKFSSWRRSLHSWGQFQCVLPARLRYRIATFRLGRRARPTRVFGIDPGTNCTPRLACIRPGRENGPDLRYRVEGSSDAAAGMTSAPRFTAKNLDVVRGFYVSHSTIWGGDLLGDMSYDSVGGRFSRDRGRKKAPTNLSSQTLRSSVKPKKGISTMNSSP